MSGKSQRLQIAVIGKDRDRARLIVNVLREQGNSEISVIADVTGLSCRLTELDPTSS
ncbi:MAG: hypothetical protein AAF713_21990 [Pseudomonadota bacterium]